MKNLYVINGINSELAQLFLKKITKNDTIVGIHKSSYKGINSKNILLTKSINNLTKIIENKFKGNKKKIVFINFAAVRDEKILINLDINKINSTLESNILSSIKISKKLVPLMIKYNFGRFIFMSSKKAEQGSEGNILYSFSKSGLYGLSRSISKEYKEFNITSNIISLGYFNSKMWNSLNTGIQKKLLKQTLYGKLGNTSVIFDTIKLIVKHPFINMTKINLDGGLLE
ncbi:SDR family oxidoreductase [Candidatus Pelagibacter sp.]|nr:SDR family oxidoreductase [Candidatus Pelagibacter sp.]